jgi:drug/metabolite transporter (DMT)-like permease
MDLPMDPGRRAAQSLAGTPATDAALIVSLENIFAALSGYIFLAERLTPIGILGCVIIIVAVLIVEIKVLTSNKIS